MINRVDFLYMFRFFAFFLCFISVFSFAGNCELKKSVFKLVNSEAMFENVTDLDRDIKAEIVIDICDMQISYNSDVYKFQIEDCSDSEMSCITDDTIEFSVPKDYKKYSNKSWLYRNIHYSFDKHFHDSGIVQPDSIYLIWANPINKGNPVPSTKKAYFYSYKDGLSGMIVPFKDSKNRTINELYLLVSGYGVFANKTD